jgi:hypothetical protein
MPQRSQTHGVGSGVESQEMPDFSPMRHDASGNEMRNGAA